MILSPKLKPARDPLNDALADSSYAESMLDHVQGVLQDANEALVAVKNEARDRLHKAHTQHGLNITLATRIKEWLGDDVDIDSADD